MRTWPAVFMLWWGCGATLPTVPSQGGHRWYEVTSPHFTLWTDASAGRGKDLVQQFEEHRRVVTRGLNRSTSEVRSFVIAFDGAREVQTVMDASFIGVAFDDRNPTLQPLIVIDANADNVHEKVITHELTHVIAHGIVRNQPPWLAEGIAVYFENAQPHGGAVEVGKPREDHIATLRGGHLMPSAKLMTCAAHDCEDELFYATSWVLFSYLLDQHADELGQYLERVAGLPRDKAELAWRATFPALTYDELDRQLSNWLAFGKVRLLHFDVEDKPVTVAVKVMPDADIFAVRALARELSGHDKAGAAADAASSLALDPNDLLAREVMLGLGTLTIDQARATAAAHPTEWRAQALILGFEHQRADAVAVCQLAAADPGAALPHGCARAP